MELFDFYQWIDKINESSNSINMTFTFDSNYLDEVKETYYKTLTDHLDKNLPHGSSYSIKNDQPRSIEVSILTEDDDEITSAIFGPAESFSFTLYPPYVQYIGMTTSIGMDNMTNQITRIFHNAIVDKEGDQTKIRVRAMSRDDFDDKLKSVANKVIDYYMISSFPRGRSNPSEPTSSDYIKIIHSESDSESSIKELTNRLSLWLTYTTAIKVLNKMSSQLTIDLDDIRQNVLDKGLTSAIRSNDPKEQLDFLKKLIKLADPRRVEESSIVTDALITMFRILLKQYESPKEIWRELSKMK